MRNPKIASLIQLSISLHVMYNGIEADDPPNCEFSITTVNEKKVCRNTVIFMDDFQTFDNSKWSKEQFIPSYSANPNVDNLDMIFNYFDVNNVKLNDKILEITPEIVEDKIVRSGHLKMEPCTGTIAEECDKKALFQWILPPVSSGRITTKKSFAFKYGHVEITAKVPKGDWLLPEIWLVPKTFKYGPGLESGKMVMITSRGNQNLEANGTDLGDTVLESSLLLSSEGKVRSRTLRAKSEEPWHFHYNKYLFTWRPDEITVSVNGMAIGSLVYRSFAGTVAALTGFSHDEERKWLRGSAMAPFDQEFYISIGLSVGGREFPDGSVSRDYTKPWRSRTVKEMLDFWKAKDKWAPTWKENFPKLRVVSVKVTSI